MARMNIYVSDDLKERMDNTAESANWSQVACNAFEVELGEIAKRQKKALKAAETELKASIKLIEQFQADYEAMTEAQKAALSKETREFFGG
jgi:predicted transcriptional regulator